MKADKSGFCQADVWLDIEMLYDYNFRVSCKLYSVADCKKSDLSLK